MTHDLPYDAVLCDLDNVVRFYDVTHLAALERAAGLPEGATEDIARPVRHRAGSGMSDDAGRVGPPLSGFPPGLPRGVAGA